MFWNLKLQKRFGLLFLFHVCLWDYRFEAYSVFSASISTVIDFSIWVASIPLPPLSSISKHAKILKQVTGRLALVLKSIIQIVSISYPKFHVLAGYNLLKVMVFILNWCFGWWWSMVCWCVGLFNRTSVCRSRALYQLHYSSCSCSLFLGCQKHEN